MEVGRRKQDLDTPFLCVDLDRFENNVQRIVQQCAQRGVHWRPHAKGFKSVAIARRLLDAGAIGLTCAKLGEAEVFGRAGVNDLLIANMLVGAAKIQRLVALAGQCDVIVCVDDRAQVDPLSQAAAAAGRAIRVVVEIDLGLQRVGVSPGPAVLRMAAHVHQAPGLRLAGVMGYEGHLLTVRDPMEKRDRIVAALGHLELARNKIHAAGLPCDIVSCGGTGSLRHALAAPGVTEIQAGGGVWMDAFYRRCCQVTDLDYALTVCATVVSRPAPERAVIDAGRKTLNSEVAPAEVLHPQGLELDYLSAEHGVLKVAPDTQLAIGDRVELVPGYADLTTFLHDRIYAFRQDRLEAVWELDARYALS